MADLQRTVEARLKVTKEGDAEAFQEVATEVDKLRAAAGETADVLPDITDALKDVEVQQEATGKATEGHVRQIRSLQDIFKTAGGAGGDFALKVLAVGGALTVAKKALSEAVEGLNELDKAAGGTGEAYSALAGVIPYPKKAFEEFARAIVDSKGHFEEHTGVLDKQIAAYEKARVAYLAAHEPIVAAATAAEAASAAHEKWAESLGLSKAALDKQAGELVEHVKQFADANKQLTQTDLAAIFGPKVAALLAQYGTLKVGALSSLLEIGSAWHVTTKNVERAVSEQGVSTEKLKKQVQEAVDKHRELGEAIPESLAKAAEGVGVVVGAWERHNTVTSIVRGELKNVVTDAENTAGSLAGAAASFEVYGKAMAGALEGTRTVIAAVGTDLDGLSEKAKAAAMAVQQVIATGTSSPQASMDVQQPGMNVGP